MNIRGLRVVVTVGAAGTGLAPAGAFVRRSARVFICDVDADAQALE